MADVPASVAITEKIIAALPVLVPMLFLAVGQLILQIRGNKKVIDLDTKVDGRLTELIREIKERGRLEVQVATASGVDQGKASAELIARVQAAEVAEARALPPLGHVEPTTKQIDRIESTGIDTNERVQKVEGKIDPQKP